MDMTFGKYLRNLRQMRDLKQEGVAKAIGVTPSMVGQWERDVSKPSVAYLTALAAFYGVSVDELIKLQDIQVPEIRGTAAIADHQLPTRRDMPNDVPLMGQTVGGADGAFSFNGETVDYVRRPPGIANQKGVFAVTVIGTSMVPRYEDGEIVYVSSLRRPQIGDYVIVEMIGEEDGAPGKSFIKRLTRRTQTAVVCEQFNPAGAVEYDVEDVKQVLRVIPWKEVVGI